MFKKWQYDKEFDTKTLLTDIDISDIRKNDDGDTEQHGSHDSVDKTKEAFDLKDFSDAVKREAPGKKTQVYEPRPLTPDDDIYEDILEQLSFAPTKPKYWFEEFGDYWSCSCGHINKGERCKSCGLERSLLRSLFILHKPAGEPGKLSKKLKSTRNQVDKEEAAQALKDQYLQNSTYSDINNIRPIIQAESNPPVQNYNSNQTAEETRLSDSSEAKHPDLGSAANIPQSTSNCDNSSAYVNIPVTADSACAEDSSSSAANAAASAYKKTSGKRQKKNIIIITAIIICLALASIAGYYAYQYFAVPALADEDAQNLQNSGKYEEAIKKYEELKGYKDSEDMIWECYCSIGDRYFEKDSFHKAIETYNTALDMKDSDTLHDKIWDCYCRIGDKYLHKGKYLKAIKVYNKALESKDSDNIRDKINKAKFKYVKAHLTEGGSKFETYLTELMNIKYSGIKAIYDEYYAWHVKIIVNTSEKDFETDMSTISRKETAYFHSVLSGGEPDESIELYYEITWPDGTSQTYDTENTWKSGAKITARFQYPMPLFGTEGKLTFKLYDKSTQEILGTDTVSFSK